ncbi:MSMEG_0565 family glycosyltransferase [Chroococcus sp. FPU101]|uniref:MSMEG_0565 family glycosyltransferase n=1 Tax=Chroococcus sp. FPU101 TaxID=1974212 RepID=UPI001A8D3972|nr:MSMEG_0565 family glycosyltransferase [Chroococcus sp. FPU101]
MPILKIALFTYSTKPRGSVIHTLELAQALHELGHDVCVYALDKDGTGFDYPLSCPYQAIPAQTAPDAIDALIEQRIQEFIDYLSQSHLTYNCYHAQDCISANALAKLVKDEKIPHFIRTVHHIEDYSNLYLQHCQDRSIRDAALCLCVSEHWQTQLEQQYQIKAPRVINAVNTRRFSPVFDGSESFLKQQLGLRGSPIYLTVGGIEPRKNSICLLKAFSLILQEYPNAQLIIAGGATLFDYQSYRDQFFALADQLKIEIGHSLILPGVIQDADLPTLYRIADAFVFPSVKEGWGLVILEAIASGIPVITSNHAPFTEFLFLQEALLVDPTSSDAIFQAMQSILNPTLAKSLITHSQAVLAQYTWETSAKMHINHYQQLLQSYA